MTRVADLAVKGIRLTKQVSRRANIFDFSNKDLGTNFYDTTYRTLYISHELHVFLQGSIHGLCNEIR